MIVEAKNFHPMRGHVDQGVVVKFSNGEMLSLRPDGIGWALFNAGGERVSDAGLDAWGLTRLIVQKESP